MSQGHARSTRRWASYFPHRVAQPGTAGAGRAAARLLSSGVAAWLLIGAAGPAHADDFVIDGDETETNGGETLDGDDSLTISKSGSITTTADSEHGVNATGGNNLVTNSGRITVSGSLAAGIRGVGGDNDIINRGGIVTEGLNAPGIQVSGGTNTVTNWGSIRTSAVNADGIRSIGGTDVIANWGSIHTTEIDARGIFAFNGGSVVTNWGSITASGDNGIEAHGGGNSVSNWGRIHAFGDAILGQDGTDSVTNGGMVVSEQGNAIRLRGTGNSLNLLAPGFLEGQLNLGGGTRLNLTTGPSHSVLWDFTGTVDGGAPTIAGPYAGFYNQDTQEYATFDPTALAGTVNQFGHMQGLLSSLGRSGLARAESAHVQVADSSGETASGGGGILPWDGRVWAGVFGGVYDHDGDDATLDRDIDLKGFAAGYSARPLAGLTVSAMAGYLRGSQDADAKYAPSYRLDSTGLFAGANGRMAFGLFDLDVGLTGGRLSYDSDRFINDNLAPSGESWATASFDGWFVIPEVGVSTALEWTGIITVRPSARVSYAYQHVGSYQESGSRADASVDGRTLSLLTGTAELAFEKQLFDMVTVNAVGGYEKRLNVGDDAVSMQLINVTNEVEIGDTDSAAFYAGGGLSVDIGDHINLAVEARTYLNGDFSGSEGHARLSIAF